MTLQSHIFEMLMVLSVGCRMLDVVKTVRSKALMLLLSVLGFVPVPGRSKQRQATQAAQATNQACAVIKRAAAKACFPAVCAVLDALPASALYDDGCQQVRVMETHFAILLVPGNTRLLGCAMI